MKKRHSRDIYLWVLNELRKIPIGSRRFMSDFEVNDKGLLIEIIKTLIRTGWSEYELTNDYSAIKRLDLPNYAKDYFTKLRKDYEQSKQNNDGSDTVAKVNEKT